MRPGGVMLPGFSFQGDHRQPTNIRYASAVVRTTAFSKPLRSPALKLLSSN